MQKFKKTKKKLYACKAAVGGPLLEISYIPILSEMTLHYHGVYQISSLEANLSLEDLKGSAGRPSPKLMIKPDLF